jgi:hypothetical protein
MRVPDRVAKYHALVKDYQANKEWQYVTKEHVPRAARIVQAFVDAAQTRGYDVLSASSACDGLREHEARSIAKGYIALKAEGSTYALRMKEMPGPRAPKIAPRRWNEAKRHPAWIDTRGWEFISTGRLELQVFGRGCDYDGDKYRDAKSRPLEDRLPEVFQSFGVHRLRREQQDAERECEEARGQQLWESAMERARVAYAENYRMAVLQQQSRDWQMATELTKYVEVMKATALTQTQPG